MVFSFAYKVQQTVHPLGWLMVFCLLLQGPSPVVLCLGSNGHVAMEAPHRRVPHATSQSQTPCLDLPLIHISGNTDAPVITPPATQQGWLPIAMLATVSFPVRVPSAAARWPLTASRNTPAAVWLRTVILLI